MSFHLYRINELYSNASGTIQFIELASSADGQSAISGVPLTASAGSVTHTFNFPGNLPSTATANTTVLIATQGFAALGIVTPNFIVPDGFLFTAGGSLNFGNVDFINYGALPADGASSVNRNGQAAAATPRNFAGTTGTLPPPTSGPPTINGTAGNDTLAGTAAAEIIDGLGGDDTLRSGGGNDTLRGGSGDDTLYSGSGNDTIDGGLGFDYLTFAEATAGVTIDMRNGTASGGAGSDTFVNVELLFGSNFADTFTGHDGGVRFLGLDGNDTITGGAGDDQLEGNAGNDIIDGLGGRDQVAYYSAAGPVFVDLAAGTATGGLGNDTLRSIEEAIGSVFGDTLTGSNADNRLAGEDGNDTLVGSAGSDMLDGGAGRDTVVYAMTRASATLNTGLATNAGIATLEKPNAAGIDTLTGIERLQFSDTRVALDFSGAAGQTARLLGVVFGPASVSTKQFVGIGISILDAGTPYEQLAALAVAAAGKTSHADVVSLLWTNLFGTPPSAAQAAPFVALLDGGVSVGALTVAAANLDLNATNINLTGLMLTGLEYVLP